MTEELARALFFIIWGTGLVLWALALRRSLAYLRPAAVQESLLAADPIVELEPSGPGLRRGTVEVPGEAEPLGEEVAGRLAADLGGTFVVRQERDTLVCTNSLSPAFSQLGWANVSRAVLRVTSVGAGRSQVAYELGARPLQRRLGKIGLVVVFAAGLPTLLTVGALIWYLVLPSQVPAVRWQVFQTFQIVHALWPPFLVLSRLGAHLNVAERSLAAVIQAAGEAVGG
jgi:hypothetical protein